MTTHTHLLEVLQTPLAFHGGPEVHLTQLRAVLVDDIESVHAHAARSEHGWHPICTLNLFGGEQITIAGNNAAHHRHAHQHAVELAGAYQAYLPYTADDTHCLPPPTHPEDAPPTFHDCATCASLNTSLTYLEGSAS